MLSIVVSFGIDCILISDNSLEISGRLISNLDARELETKALGCFVFLVNKSSNIFSNSVMTMRM